MLLVARKAAGADLGVWHLHRLLARWGAGTGEIMAFPTIFASETTFWLVALGVVVVLVFGVLALIATLLYLVRSISLSVRQLREVAEVQATQRLATQRQATQQQAAQGPATQGPATQGDSADRSAASPASGAPADGERGAGGSEASDGEQGNPSTK